MSGKCSVWDDVLFCVGDNDSKSIEMTVALS